MFAPRLDILPTPQLRLWPELARIPSHFVLYGGTAIALWLGHRDSVDFDFFSDVSLDDNGKEDILCLFGVGAILQNERDTLVFTATVDDQPVKLSFFGGMKNGCVAEPTLTHDGVACVASLDDLFAHKLKAIHDRAEGKDYQDIAVMLMNGQSLARGLAAREALFGSSVPAMLTLKALTYFSDVNEPERITVDMKNAITKAIQSLPRSWDAVPLLSRTLAHNCVRANSRGPTQP
jgi:hypothetical protein